MRVSTRWPASVQGITPYRNRTCLIQYQSLEEEIIVVGASTVLPQAANQLPLESVEWYHAPNMTNHRGSCPSQPPRSGPIRLAPLGLGPPTTWRSRRINRFLLQNQKHHAAVVAVDFAVSREVSCLFSPLAGCGLRYMRYRLAASLS